MGWDTDGQDRARIAIVRTDAGLGSAYLLIPACAQTAEAGP